MQPAHRAQNSPRGIRASDRGRGRGRGNGFRAAKAGASSASASPSQGTGQRGTTGRPFRGIRGLGAGRARGHVSQRFSSPPAKIGQPTLPMLTIHPAPEDIKPYEHEQLEARRTKLSEQYEKYRQNAIAQGLMSDDKQSSLDDAIKTIGTCTQMCDEKERVNRIYESQTDAAERLPHPGTGRSVPIEGRMVKKFRRSAAGVDKQIPEELRTPHTLQKTLDYLFDEIIGQNRLGKHHKFVWDRTRAIRNDFSIQSLTSSEHVRAEVDCYERIVRFHILAAHQLSNPASLEEDEHFEHQQELEQLQKTFQSLMDKYDTFHNTIDFPNEAEFRAYYILFSPILFSFDTEVQIQQWPLRILNDGRVQTALSLYASMGNTSRSVGSKNLDPVPVAIAQANAGHFWELLHSQRVGYLMACVAEMSFQNVRFTSLAALWQSVKNASPKMLERMTTWTKDALTNYLWFDHEEETETLCAKVNVTFSRRPDGQEYLDFRSNSASRLDNPFSKPEQVFSGGLVEAKRHGRTLVAVMNGMSIAQARRADMIEDDYETPAQDAAPTTRSTMFFGEDETEQDDENASGTVQHPSVLGLNPQAIAFTPGVVDTSSTTSNQPTWMHSFGQERTSDVTSPGGPPKGLFGVRSSSQAQVQTQKPSAATTDPFTVQNLGNNAASPFKQTTTSVNDHPIKTPTFSSSQPTLTIGGASASTQNEEAHSAAGRLATSEPAAPFSLTDQHQPWTPPQLSSLLSTTTSLDKIAGQVAVPKSDFLTQKPSSEGPTFNLDKFAAPQASQPPSTKPQSTFGFDFSSKAESKPLPSTQQARSDSIIQESLPKFSFASTHGQETASNTPSQSVKRPSLTDFTFPAVSKTASTKQSHTPPGSPKQPTLTQPHSSLPASVSSGPVLQLSPAPTSVSTEPAHVETTEEPINEEELLAHLCRIGLVQEDGILDMFVSYKVSQIVKDVYQAFHTQVFRQRITALKQNYLRRKFFDKWRFVVEQRRLQKRASRRREKLAASVHAANEKRRKEEAEVKEILEAQSLRKQIYEEREKQRQQASESTGVRDMPPPNRPQSTASQQVAGQKRKVLANSTSSQNLQGNTMSPIHKRSRTLGNSEHPAPRLAPTESLRSSVGGSSLRRSLSYRTLKQSTADQGLDQTRSDYFRLKAHGIDPDTPLVPETAKDIEARKEREATYQETVNSRVLRRPASSAKRTAIESPAPEPVRSSALSTSTSQRVETPQQRPANISKPGKDDDPFLQQLREAREAMSADESWFKTQTTELEKEVELQEEFRRSHGSIASHDDSVLNSSTGFARSQSGRDYVPLDLKPGQTLSRTEMRIRQTGAHGFATKPIGGSPVSTPRSDYSTVAMSRRTASKLQSNHLAHVAQTVTSHIEPHSQISKRSIEDVYHTNGHGDLYEQPAYALAHKTQHVHKKQRNGITVQALHELGNPSKDMLNHPASDSHQFDKYIGYEDEEEEGDEEIEGEELSEEEGKHSVFRRSHAHNALEYEAPHPGNRQHYYEEETDDAEDGGDEDEDELVDEDEEEDDAEEDLEYAEHYYGEEEEEAQPQHGYYTDENGDFLPPPRLSGDLGHHSRAMHSATPDTGVGSTAAEAIELSD